jgi:hypothetical protein
MSMAAQKKNPLRWGGCIAYGPPIDFGLPIEVPEDRPLVIAHPAAAMHHHASFGLVSDAGHPFIHVMVDRGDYSPTGWGINANVAGMATWQRIADTTQGHTVCRKAALSTPHWQVHIVGEAFATLTNLPPIDILYVDWLEWLEAHAPQPCRAFDNALSSFVHKVREGGLVVLDHKHKAMIEANHPWYANVNDDFVHLPCGSLLANKGLVEWMSPDLYGEYQSHMATVYEVHHGVEGTLAEKDWEQAMHAWTWTVMPEVSKSPAVIQAMLNSDTIPSIHPKAMTQNQWMKAWLRHQDEHEAGSFLLGPTPPLHAWPPGAYVNYLQWLLDHPSLLLGDVPKKTYRLLGETFKLHIVHGDLLRLAPALYGQGTVLAVREGLRQKVVARSPRWLGQALELQSPESWMSNPVKRLTWSGDEATPHLTKTMLEFAKSQPYSPAYPNIKSMKVQHIVTVSHGTASLGEVMRAVMAYYDSLPPMMGRAPMEMTIVCLDEDDYTDLHSLPHQFQFLPNDGSCID